MCRPFKRREGGDIEQDIALHWYGSVETLTKEAKIQLLQHELTLYLLKIKDFKLTFRPILGVTIIEGVYRQMEA